MAETDCQASGPGIGVPLAGSAGHCAAGRGGQRLVTAHVCLPLLPISDLSRLPFRSLGRFIPASGAARQQGRLGEYEQDYGKTATIHDLFPR